MSVISKFSADWELFECCSTLEVYKCHFCVYTTNEKIHRLNHVCGATTERGDVSFFKQCNRCNAGSFSFLWHFFNQKEDHFYCSSSKSRTTAKESFVLFKQDGTLKTNEQLRRDKQIFKCDDCGFLTTRQSYLQKHQKRPNACIDNALKHWQCDQCDLKTTRGSSLQLHKIKVHKTDQLLPKLLKCDQCEFETTAQKCFQKHRNKKHTPNEAKHWQCLECSFKTTRQSSLQLHVNKKHKFDGVEPIYECDRCWYKTTNKKYLREHRKRKQACFNNKSKRWECDQCGLKTTRKQNLIVHKERKHGLPKMEQCFQCDECEFKTTERIYLKGHKNRQHSLNRK